MHRNLAHFLFHYTRVNNLVMRKIVLFLAVCCAMMVQAASYGYLVFTNTDATITSFSVTNLTLTVNGSDLQVTNDEGSVNLVLTDLASMQFSKDGLPEGLNEVLDADQPLDVFTPTGVRVGRFNNLLEAAGSLGKGVYVITNGKHSQTIILQ